eukprot:gene367-687_t
MPESNSSSSSDCDAPLAFPAPQLDGLGDRRRSSAARRSITFDDHFATVPASSSIRQSDGLHDKDSKRTLTKVGFADENNEDEFDCGAATARSISVRNLGLIYSVSGRRRSTLRQPSTADLGMGISSLGLMRGGNWNDTVRPVHENDDAEEQLFADLRQSQSAISFADGSRPHSGSVSNLNKFLRRGSSAKNISVGSINSSTRRGSTIGNSVTSIRRSSTLGRISSGRISENNNNNNNIHTHQKVRRGSVSPVPRAAAASASAYRRGSVAAHPRSSYSADGPRPSRPSVSLNNYGRASRSSRISFSEVPEVIDLENQRQSRDRRLSRVRRGSIAATGTLGLRKESRAGSILGGDLSGSRRRASRVGSFLGGDAVPRARGSIFGDNFSADVALSSGSEPDEIAPMKAFIITAMGKLAKVENDAAVEIDLDIDLPKIDYPKVEVDLDSDNSDRGLMSRPGVNIPQPHLEEHDNYSSADTSCRISDDEFDEDQDPMALMERKLKQSAKKKHSGILKRGLRRQSTLKTIDESKFCPRNSGGKRVTMTGAEFRSYAKEIKKSTVICPLHEMAGLGWESLLRAHIEAGHDFDQLDYCGRSPIYIGAANGHNNVIQCLAEMGANIKLPDRMGRAPLHAAAFNGQSQCIEFLVNELKENIHSVDHFGKTPLHLATESGNVRECEMLLRLKAEPEVTDLHGDTPLKVAVRVGHKAVLEFLLKAGCDSMARDGDGCTPLHIASFCERLNCIQTLVHSSVDVNVCDNHGLTPLHFSARHGVPAACKLLLELKANPARQNSNGQTALHLAAQSDQLAVLEELAKTESIDLNHADEKGYSALHSAVVSDLPNSVLKLIELGARLDVRTSEQDTGLHLAAKKGLANMVLTLCRGGCDPNMVSTRNQTALHIACSSCQEECVTSFLMVPENNPQNIPVNFTALDSHKRTALHIACSRGKASIVELLVRRVGISIAANSIDAGGHTPLSIAIKKDHVDVVQQLFRLSCEPNTRNRHGLLPLQQACVDGSSGCVQLLLGMKNASVDYSVI